MKTINFFNRHNQFFSTSLFMLAFAGLFFVSCEKETIVEVPVVVPVTDTCELVHEVEDLIAWYSPLTDVLLVDPGYLENALEVLQAQPSSDGGYSMQGINLFGEPRTVYFKIALAHPSDIYISAEETEKVLTPDLIQTFSEKGTSYRIYKNAQCGNEQAAFDSQCENNTDGSSTRRSWYAMRKCERGNGFCTEAKSLIGRSVTFHNAGCQGPIRSEEGLYGYACWQ